MMHCRCREAGHRDCVCGACVNGVARDGAVIHIPLMMKDGQPVAPSSGRTLSMMTDTEIRTMRDRVKTMTASEAAKLPIYDNVRGALMGGGPAEVHCALVDGARPDPVNDEKIDRMAHQVLYEHRVGNAWRGADNVPPFKAKHQDNGQSAYEKRLADAWRHG